MNKDKIKKFTFYIFSVFFTATIFFTMFFILFIPLATVDNDNNLTMSTPSLVFIIAVCIYITFKILQKIIGLSKNIKKSQTINTSSNLDKFLNEKLKSTITNNIERSQYTNLKPKLKNTKGLDSDKSDFIFNDINESNTIYEDILEEHNIDKKTFARLKSFYNRPIFKNKLNPNNKNDQYTIESIEFQKLKEIGMVYQEPSEPFFFHITPLEDLIKVLLNQENSFRDNS